MVLLFPRQVLPYRRNGKMLNNDKKMKKYSDFSETEKQQYEEALLRNQEDRMNKV